MPGEPTPEAYHPAHLAALQTGVDRWNAWRSENPVQHVELVGADLRGLNLSGADLSWGDFTRADLRGVVLRNANLFNTKFTRAQLLGADLREANGYQSEYYRADLTGADLTNADLRGAKFHNADLRGAILRGADLFRVDFIGTHLAGADFSDARCASTTFANLDLSDSVGLMKAKHAGPSHVDISTLLKSKLAIPDAFLSGVGIPEFLARSLSASLRGMSTGPFHSCFISYSSSDDDFASALYSRMRAEGLRVWFAPENIRGGAKIIEQIERAIQDYDKLLLVLSGRSMTSPWVVTEIRNALEAERQTKKRKLFPIRLTGLDAIRQWRLFDSESGQDLAVLLREYHIPDFSEWRNSVSFEKSFFRLLDDLKSEEAPGPVLAQRELSITRFTPLDETSSAMYSFCTRCGCSVETYFAWDSGMEGYGNYNTPVATESRTDKRPSDYWCPRCQAVWHAFNLGETGFDRACGHFMPNKVQFCGVCGRPC
jgi:uncharacterized protein YjbI with pentapeptide repeats